MKRVIAYLGTLIVGVLIGYLMGNFGGDKREGAVVGKERDAAERYNRVDGDDGRGADARPVKTRSGERDFSPVRTSGHVSVSPEVLRSLSNASVASVRRADFFNGDDPLIGALKINEQEEKALEEKWDEVRQGIQQLEASAARSNPMADGSVKIVVPDLSQSLGPLGREFELGIEEIIGQDRAAALLTIKQVDSVFSPEKGESHYHVSVEAVGDGKWRYHMVSEVGEDRQVWIGESVPQEIRHITDAARVTPSLAEINESQD